MAFAIADVNRIANGSMKVFAYKSADAIGTIVASGYFDDIYAELSQGDMILVASGVGGTEAADVLVVSSATGATTVTTAALA